MDVLLVEDDEDLRGALELVLEARGFDVTTAADAEAAISAVRESAFGAVVTDLGLPDVSGQELVRELRSAAPSTRVVVLTGHGEPELERACRRAGADVVLTKPVSGDRLAALLGN